MALYKEHPTNNNDSIKEEDEACDESEALEEDNNVGAADDSENANGADENNVEIKSEQDEIQS